MGAGRTGPMTQGILGSGKVTHSLGFTAVHSGDQERWPRKSTCKHAGCRTQLCPQQHQRHPKCALRPTSGSEEKYMGVEVRTPAGIS